MADGMPWFLKRVRMTLEDALRHAQEGKEVRRRLWHDAKMGLTVMWVGRSEQTGAPGFFAVGGPSGTAVFTPNDDDRAAEDWELARDVRSG